MYFTAKLLVAMGFVLAYSVAVMTYGFFLITVRCDNLMPFTFGNKQYQCYQIKPESTSKDNVT